jgi:hypothetical protein
MTTDVHGVEIRISAYEKNIRIFSVCPKDFALFSGSKDSFGIGAYNLSP